MKTFNKEEYHFESANGNKKSKFIMIKDFTYVLCTQNNFCNKQIVFIDVCLFILITLLAHKFYWTNIQRLEEWDFFITLRKFLKKEVFIHSSVLLNLFTDQFTFNYSTIYLSPTRYICINESCAGFKQFYQLIILFIFFPGSLKHKLWYIPLTIIIIHITNIFRIIVLSVILIYYPEHWEFSHDWILRPFFYIVIFGMWWVWNEKFRKKKERIDKVILKNYEK